MPYTRVTRTSRGADAIMYARGFGRGHNGAGERNIYVAGVNMLPDSAVPFEEQMRPYWNRANRRHTTQVDRFILSFATEELDPGKPEDCLKALEIAREFAREIAPCSQAAVFVQADGKGGKLHVHVLVNDVRMDDGKGIDSSAYYFPHFSAVADRICARYFDLKQPEPAAEKVSQTVRGRREKAAYIWQDDLRDRIRRAADGAADEDDFARRLRLDGVELVPRERKDGTLSYRRPATKTCPSEYYVYELADVGGFEDKPPANLKSRSYKLGTDFMPDAVARLFQPQAQAGAEREDELAIGMPEAPKPRKPAKEREAPEKPRTGDPEMERAERTARRIVFSEYRRFMGWGMERPMRTVDGEEQEDTDEMARQAGLFQEDWDNFGRWRVRRRKELKSWGGNLEPIYRKDKSSGMVSVEKENLLAQFDGFLAWLAAERLRKRNEERQAAMIEEWERARDGDRGYGDD